MISDQSWMASAFTLACLYSVVVAALIYFFCTALDSICASLRQWRALWLAALLCATLPLINGLIPRGSTVAETETAHSSEFLVQSQAAYMSDEVQVRQDGIVTLVQEWLLNALQKAAPIWLVLFVLGFFVQSMVQLWQWLRVRNIVATAEVLNDVDQTRIDDLLQQIKDPAAKQWLQQHSIRLLKSKRIHSPFVLCILKPTLVVSDTALVELSNAQLALVLEHECIHLSNRDPIFSAVARWAVALLWFNPFAHRLYQRFSLAVELNCDARVLARGGEVKRQYLHAILSILNAGNGSHLTLNSSAFGDSPMKILKQRLLCIQKPLAQSPRGKTRMLGLILAVVSFMAVSIFLQPSMAQPVDNIATLIAQLQTQLPAADVKVSSKFGVRSDPFDGAQVKHGGIDYAGKNGTAIVATGSGQISFAGAEGNYGKKIEIEHGQGVSTIYANLGEIKVSKGQIVKQGDVIALMGVSGRSTGPHVHYEVRRDGQSICPSVHCQSEGAEREI